LSYQRETRYTYTLSLYGNRLAVNYQSHMVTKIVMVARLLVAAAC